MLKTRCETKQQNSLLPAQGKKEFILSVARFGPLFPFVHLEFHGSRLGFSLQSAQTLLPVTAPWENSPDWVRVSVRRGCPQSLSLQPPWDGVLCTVHVLCALSE